MTADGILDRVSSVCGALGYVQAQTPFSFDLQPTGQIDRAFRVELSAGSVIGGFNYAEERTDLLTVWVARKYHGQPTQAYRDLTQDATSLRAAVIRDGADVSGEYFVPDGDGTHEISREPNTEYAVLRLQVPVNYELTN